jgi:uncharacterized protein YpiB (UPF0302 family)
MIAAKLDKSSKPNKDFVIRDLKHVLANMGNVAEQEQQQEQQSQQQQGQQQGYGQQEQQALPQSGTGKQMLEKMLSDAGAALKSGDEAKFKGLLEKLQQHS